MSPSQTTGAAARSPMARIRRSANAGSPRAHKPPADEASLVERLKQGDQSALEAIFELYSGKLYRVAQRILGEPADAEEVIQDVFWTLYRKADTFKGESRLSTWLYRLTVNAALGRVRRGRKKKDVEYDEFMPKFQKDGHHLVRPVVDWSDTLDEKYGREEIHALIGKALEQLKPIDKSVIVLSDLEDLSDKEIAGALGLTVAAVKTRLHRARLFMRGVLAVKLGYWRRRKKGWRNMAKPLRPRKMRIDDSCETMTELLSDYLNGRLRSSLRREFEAHLKICPDCVSFLNTYQKTAALGAAISARDIPANVRAKVLAFLRRKAHKIAVFLFSLISQAGS